jgi:hypothetical protein
MDCNVKLNVIGYSGTYLGSIFPIIGLVTTQGRVERLNEKSIILVDEDGITSRVRKEDYTPSALYSTFTDEHLAIFIPDPKADLSLDNSIRALRDLGTSVLTDIIARMVNDHITKDAYNNHSKGLYGKGSELSDDSKIAFIHKILS